MSDAPGRRTFDPPDGEVGSDDRGRPSPVPEGYGDLWPQRAPAAEPGPESVDGAPSVTSTVWGRRARHGSRRHGSPGAAFRPERA